MRLQYITNLTKTHCACDCSMSIYEPERSVSSTFESTSNPPDIENSECNLNNSACGEPLVTQRVSLDFTPNDFDNDFIQRKCCAFWEYINSRPELNQLNVAPDPDVYSNVSESSVITTHVPSQEQISSHSITKTAVNMLEFVEEKGLIDRAFEAKLPKSYCEIELMTSSDESVTGLSKAQQLDNNKVLKHKKQKTQPDVIALPKLRIMCNKMNEWDKSHPKSMKPPGPPPALPEDIKLIRY